ncbi:MAG: hypothetical protein A2X59_04330, partial [Nitrospirae bacterium GWC2_42_7]
MRRSSVFFIFLISCFTVISFLLIKSGSDISKHQLITNDISDITSALKLTDLTLFSDARYTRHPSQADLFSAFQD